MVLLYPPEIALVGGLVRAVGHPLRGGREDGEAEGVPLHALGVEDAGEEILEIFGEFVHIVLHDDTVGQLSSVVTEEINNSYVIVRGRKEVLFRKRKRLIEIQGLIARKDVSPDDKITSDNFLESSIKIIR